VLQRTGVLAKTNVLDGCSIEIEWECFNSLAIVLERKTKTSSNQSEG
jgi:hypothetical protein